MAMDRRQFLNVAGGALAATAAASSSLGKVVQRPKIRAIAFDGFTVFDSRSIVTRAEELFPGKGAELSEEWRTRQFQYTWLRSLSRRYADLWQVTEEALSFAVRKLRLDLRPAARSAMMEAYLELKPWPDAAQALKTLKEAGIRLAFLSDFTAKMLDAAVKSSGLTGIFEEHLTTDRVSAYKPDPRAYQMALEAFAMKQQEIAFVASAGWDAAGAKWFGFPTVWLNRANIPMEELGVTPDVVGTSLTELVQFALPGRVNRP